MSTLFPAKDTTNASLTTDGDPTRVQNGPEDEIDVAEKEKDRARFEFWRTEGFEVFRSKCSCILNCMTASIS